jgi:hypothetical protein
VTRPQSANLMSGERPETSTRKLVAWRMNSKASTNALGRSNKTLLSSARLRLNYKLVWLKPRHWQKRREQTLSVRRRYGRPSFSKNWMKRRTSGNRSYRPYRTPTTRAICAQTHHQSRDGDSLPTHLASTTESPCLAPFRLIWMPPCLSRQWTACLTMPLAVHRTRDSAQIPKLAHRRLEPLSGKAQ